ncbi:MAG TPA: 4Fe-4S dicluster domain-containing protein [Thermodesulfobacteriota bacterium]|nr:4Fe-4S dicluster domain-containing protein [Thermodesulfobacteriota bacterium]
MKLKLDKKDFGPFLQSLMDHYDLYAPVQLTEGVSAYKKVLRPEEVNFNILNPQKPLKEVFFPQSEVMFCYQKVGKKSQVTSGEEVKRERVILGARPCDIEALSLIEEVYCGKEYTDVYFKNKRAATTIIGMACDTPLSTCFCASTGGGPFIRKGSDAFFIDLGDAYLVELLTENGEGLQQNQYFKKAPAKDIALAKEAEKKALSQLESSSAHPLPFEGIEKKLDTLVESPFWDRLHEKCIGCSTCTFLCPTCHCFDIVDEASGNQGQRVRNWDSCLSPLYSLETSGHNPRSTGRERTRQRIMHKLNYFPKLFGKIACVGCGRCILYCPVNFDIRQTIEEIQKEPIAK